MVNCYGMIDTGMPFGGYKQSGFGREGSRHALDLFTQIKSVYVKDLTNWHPLVGARSPD